MLLVFKLVSAHVKFTACNFTQTNITAAYFEFPILKTHGLTAIAAASVLVKHEWSM
jgi:hypothetical protein